MAASDYEPMLFKNRLHPAGRHTRNAIRKTHAAINPAINSTDAAKRSRSLRPFAKYSLVLCKA